MNFRRYLSLYILQKKYFCGRPHEIYFRHPVRRKQSFIFFWPNQRNHLLRNLDKRQLQRRICPFSCMLCMKYDMSILPTCGTFMADKTLSNSYFVLELSRIESVELLFFLESFTNSYRRVYEKFYSSLHVICFNYLLAVFSTASKSCMKIQFAYPAGVSKRRF